MSDGRRRDGIVGHTEILDGFHRAVARGGLHHAYLLEGPRGVGKRRVADYLTRLANCTQRQLDGSPCEVGARCPTCASIAAGTHPDVIVLEPDLERAARTIPIDAVRETIRKAQFHRYGAAHRFVILDPADAMQEPAANALLKTLEEPPSGTHFLLITHQARALLPTIRSRCQRLRFGAVPAEAVRDWLRGRGADAAAADAASRLASGCPGRAAALVEDGLQARAALRAELIAALDGSIDDVYTFSAAVTAGARNEWADRAEQVLQLIEDWARDAAVAASGASVPRMDAVGTGTDGAGTDVVARLAAGWPQAVTACARAVQEARDDLEVYVSGKTVLDALVSAVRRELRAAAPVTPSASG